MKTLYAAAPYSESNFKDWTTISGKWDLATEEGKTHLHTNAAEGLARIVAGDKEWINYSVEVRARADKWFSEKNGDYGIIVRYTDPGNYYLFLYDNMPATRGLIIQKKVDNQLITIAEKPFSYELGRWYTFKGTISGNDLTFEVDGVKMLTAQATEVAKGPAGLLAWLTEVQFDGFKVTT